MLTLPVSRRANISNLSLGIAIKGEYLGYGAEGIIYIFLFDFTRQTRCAPMDMGNRG